MAKKKKFKEPIAEIEPVDKLPETDAINSENIVEIKKVLDESIIPQHKSFFQRRRERLNK